LKKKLRLKHNLSRSNRKLGYIITRKESMITKLQLKNGYEEIYNNNFSLYIH